MLNDDNYQKRKCEKTKYYEEAFPASWWEWDVDKDEDIPAFTEKYVIV